MATITETFIANTTWVCPTGISSVQVECWAGGGGGANGGYGGGGGAYSLVTAASVTAGNSYAIVVGGGGGGGGTTGGNGGDSTFATTTVVAKGGAGGSASSGLGGAAASGTGDTKYSGGNGAVAGGGGGAGSTGDGGAASGNTGGTGTANGGGNGGTYGGSGAGVIGSFYGGGGSGATAGSAGGGGRAGAVVITYTATAPTFVSAGTEGSGSGATVVPGAPASIAANDILICAAQSGTGAATLSMSADWTEIVDANGNTTSRLGVWWHRYNGVTTPDLTVTRSSGSSAFIAGVAAFRGCETSGNPYDVLGSVGGGSDGTIEHTSITTLANLILLLIINGASDDNNRTVYYGLTSLFEDTGANTQGAFVTTTGNPDGSISMFYTYRGGPQTTGTITTLQDASDPWTSVLLALKVPAATNIKSILGLVKASVKSVNGLAIASVKSWNGLQ